MDSVTDRICNLKQNMIFEKRFFFLGNLAKNVPAHRINCETSLIHRREFCQLEIHDSIYTPYTALIQ